MDSLCLFFGAVSQIFTPGFTRNIQFSFSSSFSLLLLLLLHFIVKYINLWLCDFQFKNRIDLLKNKSIDFSRIEIKC